MSTEVKHFTAIIFFPHHLLTTIIVKYVSQACTIRCQNVNFDAFCLLKFLKLILKVLLLHAQSLILVEYQVHV